jgi:hypothetical protein
MYLNTWFSPSDTPTTNHQPTTINTPNHPTPATVLVLIPPRDSHLHPQSLYEVVGKVTPLTPSSNASDGLGLRVLSSTLWPKNERGELPDTKLFEAVVDATHRYREIFYEDGDKTMNGDGGY